MEDLRNKVVAITGGATGIGFALAKSLGAGGSQNNHWRTAPRSS